MNTGFGKLENKYSLGTGSVAEYYTKVDEKKYFAALAALSFAFGKWKKKAVSPILLIILSGAVGVLLYGV